MLTDQRLPVILAIASLPALAGCGEAVETAQETTGSGAASEAAPPAPTSVMEIFPEGLARSMVLESCGACHSAACSAIGQRTRARWSNLKEDHRDKVADMRDEDYDLLFGYLSDNFNDTLPEPVVPPQFLEGGCTPF